VDLLDLLFLILALLLLPLDWRDCFGGGGWVKVAAAGVAPGACIYVGGWLKMIIGQVYDCGE